jgi:uncharacterized protein
MAELAQLEPLRRALWTGSERAPATAESFTSDLLVLQPTPFCNIDCSYCYLPQRTRRDRMSVATARAAVAWMLENGLVARRLSIAWHGGEPLVAGRAFYREAFAAIEQVRPVSVAFTHRIQTNATLIDDDWCDLFSDHQVLVGVSVDGPAFIHDARRRTRAGQGTHCKVMRGVARLVRRGIPVQAICVLSDVSMDHATEIYDFFCSTVISDVGFNIEEIEAEHRTSTLAKADAEEQVRRFFRQLVDLAAQRRDGPRIREIEIVTTALRSRSFRVLGDNDENRPFGIVSVAHDGQ